jgi:EAL and modified HD-GYP domain-containing signal transduction protein
VQLVAEKVEDGKMADFCRDAGFELFQGYFYAKPEVLSGKRLDPAKLALMKILSLVLTDATIEAIEEEFKREPALIFGLLRLVNSAAAGLSRRIGSVREAIAVLGRRQLQRWVQLLLYVSVGDNGMRGALVQLAAARGKTMELLAGKLRPKDEGFGDEAFTCGLLSVVDVILKIPMVDVVEMIQLSTRVRDALTDRRGEFGTLLRLVEAKESDDLDALATLFSRIPGLNLDDLISADIRAAAWAMQLDQANAKQGR